MNKDRQLTTAERQAYAHLVNSKESQIVICFDLMNKSMSLHTVCLSNRSTLAHVKQAWLDCLPRLSAAAAHSREIMKLKCAFEQSTKHWELMQTPGKYVGLALDPWGDSPVVNR